MLFGLRNKANARASTNNDMQVFLSELKQTVNSGLVPPEKTSPFFAQAFALLEKPFQSVKRLNQQFIHGVGTVLQGMVQAGLRVDALAANSADQSANVQQAGAAVQELSAAATDVAQAATEASHNAHAAIEQSAHNIEVVSAALAAFRVLQSEMLSVRAEVLALSDAVTGIEEVMAFIAEVSDQTRLLALNAKIEAARAGDAGRGFAVVADEVGKLSSRTQEGTERVRQLVGEVLPRAGAAASRTEELAQEAEKAGQNVEAAQKDLGVIQDHLRHISDLLENVAAATEEQAAASQQAAASLQEAGHISHVLAQNTQELADNLAELGNQVEQLQEVVGSSGMNLDHGDILELAKADHLLWIQRLHNLFWGRLDLQPEEVASHHECRFGHWYYGDAQSHFGSHAMFKQLEEPHARVHELADEIVRAWGAGRKEEAHRLFDQLQQVSAQLMSLIDEIGQAV
ncbi:MAG: methyl-accepting chemotaxis protein [bacterium]